MACQRFAITALGQTISHAPHKEAQQQKRRCFELLERLTDFAVLFS